MYILYLYSSIKRQKVARPEPKLTALRTLGALVEEALLVAAHFLQSFGVSSPLVGENLDPYLSEPPWFGLQ